MPIYTHGHHETVLRSHRSRTAGNSAAYLLPHLRAGLSLLDVGCGPGTITGDLAGLVAPGRVTAIEPEPGPLTLARETVEAANVVFETADVHELPYADGTFDVVHAHQVLQHVHDPVRALREMRRVRAPGGVVAARDADYAAMTWYPEVPALDDWLSVYRRTARRNGGEPDAGRRLLSWARAAGFTDVESSASVWCYATPEERQWWSDGWAERILQSAIAEQAVSYGYATRADLERISAGWREWGEAADGWFAIVHAEILARG
jgi:ubiquinone/menaquinone biosynthesis C-methylase UbiE